MYFNYSLLEYYEKVNLYVAKDYEKFYLEIKMMINLHNLLHQFHGNIYYFNSKINDKNIRKWYIEKVIEYWRKNFKIEEMII